MSLSSEPVELTVDAAEAGHRLDAFLASHFPDYSRVHLRRVISAGGVKVDDRGGKPAYRLKAGQRVSIVLPEIPREAPRPENIPLDVLYEDDHVVVVNKPPGMVVHPARGHWSGTLASALQFHFGPTLSATGGLSRPGIVHRLDRDTSGVILVARNDQAHAKLAKQFAARSIEKEYFALVAGSPARDRDFIDCPIGFHPHVREKMAIRRDDAESRPGADVLRGPGAIRRLRGGEAAAEDGPHASNPRPPEPHRLPRAVRSAIRRPEPKITRGEIRRDPADETVLLDRQALHARRLRFVHPATGEPIEVEAPLPADIAAVLAELRRYRRLA